MPFSTHAPWQVVLTLNGSSASRQDTMLDSARVIFITVYGISPLLTRKHRGLRAHIQIHRVIVPVG
jgi:hypothetical protein